MIFSRILRNIREEIPEKAYSSVIAYDEMLRLFLDETCLTSFIINNSIVIADAVLRKFSSRCQTGNMKWQQS